MSQTNQLATPPLGNPLAEELRSARTAKPCALVIFGATGDLTKRKLVPALMGLAKAGLMPPNHYLSVAIDYLFKHRSSWSAEAAVGKTVVSTGLIDRVEAPATARPSAASRSSRRTAGSPPGPRVPRTSTKSTPRVSAATITCNAS